MCWFLSIPASKSKLIAAAKLCFNRAACTLEVRTGLPQQLDRAADHARTNAPRPRLVTLVLHKSIASLSHNMRSSRSQLVRVCHDMVTLVLNECVYLTLYWSCMATRNTCNLSSGRVSNRNQLHRCCKPVLQTLINHRAELLMVRHFVVSRVGGTLIAAQHHPLPLSLSELPVQSNVVDACCVPTKVAREVQ